MTENRKGERHVSAKRLVALFASLLMVAAFVPTTVSAAEGHTAENAVVENAKDGTKIAITVFKPSGASPSTPVPMVLHSHGWGGSREQAIEGTVKTFLDAGFGMVSIDQRGHGDSDGQANVQDPTKETEDIKAVIDYVAALDWVAHDRTAAGNPIADDPLLGAIGGSYGGGYQTMTALDEIADEGRTRFDALAPEITWFDLPESLAPQKVVRTVWDTALYAAGASMLPQYVHEANAWGAATGQWPDGTLYGQKVEGVPDLDSEFHKHSPVWFVERGFQIDVPVLLRQGTTDNLFNLNQGLKIFDRAVADQARQQSYFVAYNGGHALPNALPPGTPAAVEVGGGVDACSGGWTELTIAFFGRVFSGQSTAGLLPDRYNLTTADASKCISLGKLDNAVTLDVDPTGTGHVISTAGLGAPLHIPLGEGPVTVTGVPELAGKVTSLALDGRAFFGLAIGSTPADARVIQNNLMPLRRALPVQDDKFDIELPGVAVEVPEGQTLFLTISAVSDMYVGHGTKPAGALLLSELELTLPTP